MKRLSIENFNPRKMKGQKDLMVLWAELEMRMTKKELKIFQRWIAKKRFIYQGVYEEDLKQYLKELE